MRGGPQTVKRDAARPQGAGEDAIIGIARISRTTASAGRKAADSEKLVHESPVDQVSNSVIQHRQHRRGGARAEIGHQAPAPRRAGDSSGGRITICSQPQRLAAGAVWFSVVLNVNLALLNLLPVPVLDGGHILLALIEAIRRKPVNIRLLESDPDGVFRRDRRLHALRHVVRRGAISHGGGGRRERWSSLADASAEVGVTCEISCRRPQCSRNLTAKGLLCTLPPTGGGAELACAHAPILPSPKGGHGPDFDDGASG